MRLPSYVGDHFAKREIGITAFAKLLITQPGGNRQASLFFLAHEQWRTDCDNGLNVIKAAKELMDEAGMSLGLRSALEGELYHYLGMAVTERDPENPDRWKLAIRNISDANEHFLQHQLTSLAGGRHRYRLTVNVPTPLLLWRASRIDGVDVVERISSCEMIYAPGGYSLADRTFERNERMHGAYATDVDVWHQGEILFVDVKGYRHIPQIRDWLSSLSEETQRGIKTIIIRGLPDILLGDALSGSGGAHLGSLTYNNQYSVSPFTVLEHYIPGPVAEGDFGVYRSE